VAAFDRAVRGVSDEVGAAQVERRLPTQSHRGRGPAAGHRQPAPCSAQLAARLHSQIFRRTRHVQPRGRQVYMTNHKSSSGLQVCRPFDSRAASPLLFVSCFLIIYLFIIVVIF